MDLGGGKVLGLGQPLKEGIRLDDTLEKPVFYSKCA
jgi:hypothetical protein